MNPTVSAAQLQALGLSAIGVYSARVRVDDGHGLSTVSAAAQVTILLGGDADGNGKVEFADYVALELGFGYSGSWADGDFNGDGKVNFKDYVVLEANFGRSSTAQAPAAAPLSALLGNTPIQAVAVSQNFVGPIAPQALQQRPRATASWSLFKGFGQVDAATVRDLLAEGRLI